MYKRKLNKQLYILKNIKKRSLKDSKKIKNGRSKTKENLKKKMQIVWVWRRR